MNTPGLDRWRRLQASSFGGNTATSPDAYGGSTGSQLRRLNEDYNQATRLLRRQARRGDAGSALQAIKLREEATAQGIQTGGIRKRDEFNSGILDRVRTMQEGAVDREKAVEANRQIAEEAMVEPVAPQPAADAVATDTSVADRMRAGLAGMADRGTALLGPSVTAPAAPSAVNFTPPATAAPPVQDVSEARRVRRSMVPAPAPAGDFARRPRWWEQFLKS